MTEHPEYLESSEPIGSSLNHDRRNFPRVPAAHLVYIDALDGAEGAPGGLAKTLDLSISGFAVEISHPISPGNRFAVVLSLHNETISVPALSNRCVSVADDLWEVGFQIQIYSKRYFQLLSKSFADQMT